MTRHRKPKEMHINEGGSINLCDVYAADDGTIRFVALECSPGGVVALLPKQVTLLKNWLERFERWDRQEREKEKAGSDERATSRDQ